MKGKFLWLNAMNTHSSKNHRLDQHRYGWITCVIEKGKGAFMPESCMTGGRIVAYADSRLSLMEPKISVVVIFASEDQVS